MPEENEKPSVPEESEKRPAPQPPKPLSPKAAALAVTLGRFLQGKSAQVREAARSLAASRLPADPDELREACEALGLKAAAPESFKRLAAELFPKPKEEEPSK